MSSKYIPHKYSILKCDVSNQSFFVILSGFYGGYTGGDSWRLSSSISDVRLEGDDYLITTVSGSTYVLDKTRQGLTNLTSSIYNNLTNSNTIEIIDINNLSNLLMGDINE